MPAKTKRDVGPPDKDCQSPSREEGQIVLGGLNSRRLNSVIQSVTYSWIFTWNKVDLWSRKKTKSIQPSLPCVFLWLKDSQSLTIKPWAFMLAFYLHTHVVKGKYLFTLSPSIQEKKKKKTIRKNRTWRNRLGECSNAW